MNKTSNIIFYMLAGLLLFAPLARGGVQGWAVGLILLLVLIAVALFLGVRIWLWDLHWIATPLDRPILALLVLLVLSLFFSVHPRTSILALAQAAAMVGVYYLLIQTVQSRRRYKQLVNWVVGIAIFLALFGLVKMAGLNPFPWWEYDLRYPEYFLSATYGNHNHLAGWLEMSLPLLLGVVLFRHKKLDRPVLFYLALLLLGSALVLSQSRGGWFAMLSGLLLMFAWFYRQDRVLSRGWAVLLITLVLAGGLLVIVSTSTTERLLTVETGLDDSSLAARVTTWQGTLEMIWDHPLLGTGPGTFGLAYPGYQPPGTRSRFIQAHNDYLDFTAELGIGFIAVIIWMGVAFYRHGFNKMRSRSTLTRAVTLGSMAGVTAILVHSLMDFNLHIPANALLFTVLAAMVAAPGNAGREGRSYYEV